MSTANFFSGWLYCRLIITIWFLAVGTIYAKPPTEEGTDFSGNNFFWGAETNDIEAALFISPLSSSNNTPIHCTPVIKYSIKSTNKLNTINVYFPPLESCYQISLTDTKGNLVSKTSKGKALGKPMTEPLMVKIGGLNMRAGYSMRSLIQNHSEVLSGLSFNLQDYFEVTNSGKYRLTYAMRVILPQSDKGNYMTFYTTNLPTIILPSVTADVEVKLHAN